MASKQVEREIDNWVERCPLKRRSIMSRRQVLHNAKYYERLWKQTLRDIEAQAELEKTLKAFGV